MARSRATEASRKRKVNTVSGTGRSILYRRLGGLLLLVVAILSVFSLMFGDGVAAHGWVWLLRLLFGWGSYLVPLLLGAFGLALLWPTFQASYSFQRREAAGWLLLFGCFLTLFQLPVWDLPGSGDILAGGGASGNLLARLFVFALGVGAGPYVIAIAAGLLGTWLAFALGPRQHWGLLLLVFVVVAWGARKLGRLLARAGKGVVSALRTLRARRLARQESLHFRINRPEVDDAIEVPSETKPARKLPSRAASTQVPQQLPLQAAFPAAGEEIPGQPPAIDPAIPRVWQIPPLSLLEPGGEGVLSEGDIRQKVERIEETLLEFGIKARVVEVNPGPVVTQFGLDPGFRERRDRAGNLLRRDKVKVSEITHLRDDLALALAARTVRIEAPVPGRAVIGLEIPNITASVVQMRKVVETTTFQKVRGKSKLAVALGQDVSGAAVAADLAKMPHLLIAGATGSGKSVCMNAIITCLLMNATPDELRLVMIDPKRVELTSFRSVPHLLRSVVVDVEHAVTVLAWMIREMETRLKRFEAQGVRNIEGYNRALGRDGKMAMPYIVLLIDELADLMMTAADEVERSICRLAQLARATGIHLVIATQRPSVDVVTGLIKANFPTRISFAVASQVDSRTILDSVGAEQLLGSGDMLFMPADAAKPRRLQGVFLSDDEVKRVTDFWRKQGPTAYVNDLEQAPAWSPDDEKEDPSYEKAVELARQHTRVSASLLQRRLGLGYNRAARLIDLLEERGVIGGAEGGGKPREVLSMAADDCERS